jgi:hypothetical protein
VKPFDPPGFGLLGQKQDRQRPRCTIQCSRRFSKDGPLFTGRRVRRAFVSLYVIFKPNESNRITRDIIAVESPGIKLAQGLLSPLLTLRGFEKKSLSQKTMISSRTSLILRGAGSLDRFDSGHTS